MKKTILIAMLLGTMSAWAERTEIDLKQWKFAPDLYETIPPDRGWKDVTIPHDWAISGAFDRSYDLQTVTVVQNGEKSATVKTGRSGGLPWIGRGWYNTTLHIEGVEAAQPKKGDPGLRGAQYELLVDGAMSDAQIFINGAKIFNWPYGYNSFHINLTPYLKNGDNDLMIRLENKAESSRWYPGAGLYRNVHLIRTDVTHIPVWGTYITTPFVSQQQALVNIKTTVENAKGKRVHLQTRIYEGTPQKKGEMVAEDEQDFTYLNDDLPAEQVFFVASPKLWTPETPNRYFAETRVYLDTALIDTYQTTFGIRKIEFVPTLGFLLNGELRKFKGVCMHHDMGPLGTAVHPDALRHQLTMLKNMGCDAIRTSHNMPAPELVELCDEMGLMMMVESFDVWDLAKCKNDYSNHFKAVETHKTLRNANMQYTLSPNPQLRTWAERDMVNMVHHYRNNPCVMMWSIGNEVWNQTKDDGYLVAQWLQDICHREDPTRPVTCGMDQVWAILGNQFGATLDIPGLNYRTARYEEAYNRLPQKMILGSETASTVSSRGTYKFPVVIAPDRLYDDNQCSGYDVEYCSWSGLPDQDFALQDDYPWTIGQFVWTGFDYLGEPSPYDTDAWPSHSSYFGIIDLASLPKDRYWLYRSQWNKQEKTLHVLPHWTWPGQEGRITPVFVYTNYPEAELFINGASFGRRVFATKENCDTAATIPVGDFQIPDWGSAPQPQLLPRYRLMWQDAVYMPGEMKVYAYEHIGDTVVADSVVTVTAQKPHHLVLTPANLSELKQPGKSGLHYFTVSVEDQDGHPYPLADMMVQFSVSGNAKIAGVANGDAACLDLLQGKQMHLFAGQCTVIVDANGTFTLTATAGGLKPAQWPAPTKGKK